MKRLFYVGITFSLACLLFVSSLTKMASAQNPPGLPENFQERLQELIESGSPEGQELMRQAMENGGRLELTPEMIERYFGEESGGEESGIIPDDDIPEGANRLEIDPTTPEGQAILERLANGGGIFGDASTVGKEAAEIRAEYRPVISDIYTSTARILDGDKQLALAAVVAEDGYLITKASEIAKADDSVYCQIGEEEPVPAEVVAIDEEYDLALLHIEADNLTPVNWCDSDTTTPVGTFVAASGVEEDPIAVGAISVLERNPTESEQGYLGIAPHASDQGVAIGEVVDNGPAAISGLQEGDIITQVGDQEIASVEDLFGAIGGCRPGDEISLGILRDGEEQTVDVLIGSRSLSGDRASRLAGMNSLGGPLSDRAHDFPLIVQHDCVLNPEECGGPLVNLSGEVIGINIARAGRIKSYALPTHAVLEVISKLQSEHAALAP